MLRLNSYLVAEFPLNSHVQYSQNGTDGSVSVLASFIMLKLLLYSLLPVASRTAACTSSFADMWTCTLEVIIGGGVGLFVCL